MVGALWCRPASQLCHMITSEVPTAKAHDIRVVEENTGRIITTALVVKSMLLALLITPGKKPIHNKFTRNTFLCSPRCEYIRCMYSHRNWHQGCVCIQLLYIHTEGGGKGANTNFRSNSSKVLSCFRVNANTGSTCIRAIISFSRTFSCMSRFCAGVCCCCCPYFEQSSETCGPLRCCIAFISNWLA